MHSVEVAYSERAWAEVGGHIGETAVDPHRLTRTFLMRTLDLDFQSIIGQADVRRQKTLGALVGQVMTDVREESAARRQLLHGLDGTVHGGVRGMRLVAQGIERSEEHTSELQ